MAGITREERERRRLAALEAGTDASEVPTGKAESKHWPGLYYSPTDPEPTQNNMLGTKDPVWRAWFERNGGTM